MILAGIAARPVSVMNRRFVTSAMISRMRGPRVGLLVASCTSVVGRRTIARIEMNDISAETPNDARKPMLSARIPPMDGPHTVATMIAPMKSANPWALFCWPVRSST